MRSILNSFLTSRQAFCRRRRSRLAKKREIPGIIRSCASELLESRLLLASQIISSNAPVHVLAAGETVDIQVNYHTLDDNGTRTSLQADLLNFNLHFDSNALEFVGLTGLFSEDIQLTPNTVRAETDALVTGDDGDPTTDSVLLARYLDNPGNGVGWPNNLAGSQLTLFTATFRAKQGFDGSAINFSSNEAATVVGDDSVFNFTADSITLQAPVGLSVSIGDAGSVSEGVDAEFVVSLSSASASPVTVEYSTVEGDGPTGGIAGEDFIAKTGQTITFAPGETQKTITVQTIDDSIIDGDKEFFVDISNPAGASIRTARGAVIVNDNDASLPRLTIGNSAPVIEGNSATFSVTLSTAAGSEVSVQYSTANGNGPEAAENGVDVVSITNQTLVFSPGETEKTITVSTIDDSLSEPTEPFEVHLTGAVGATILVSQGTGNIIDNDSALPSLIVSDAAVITEGQNATFNVTLSSAAPTTVTVNYSTGVGSGPTAATQGADFTGISNQTLTFAPGETQKSFTVATIDDSNVEETETFEVVLSNAIGATISTSRAIGTITDNDGTSQGSGDVDGDSDFDANDSFLIHLVKLAGTNAQIDQSKGSSSLTAAQIRSNIDALSSQGGDVDGDSDFDANDSFLIHLVKLAGTNAQIDQSKGSSSLTAAQIRSNIDALSPPAAAQQNQVLQAVVASPAMKNLFDASAETASPKAAAASEQTDLSNTVGSEDTWTEFRSWIDLI